jgi:hypothetical protein
VEANTVFEPGLRLQVGCDRVFPIGHAASRPNSPVAIGDTALSPKAVEGEALATLVVNKLLHGIDTLTHAVRVTLGPKGRIAERGTVISLCIVLPPVGSARSAILLLECIEHFIGSALFSNPEIQIQVCSPGRLDARRSALLAIGFYLGSDTLRRYSLGDLATSFAEHQHYPRGRRLVLYDAEGDFDRNFDWWRESGKHRLVEPQLPFENGRSDLLTGSGSRLDIQNINLLATLLVHAQYEGYWNQLGMQFQEEMEALLERHVLNGLVDAPWVRTDDPESDDDDGFFAALEELVAYAFEEGVRIKKKGRLFPSWHEIPVRSSRGILQEVQSLLEKYRSELVRQSRLLDQGGRA